MARLNKLNKPDTAYEEGFLARMRGVALEENPYLERNSLRVPMCVKLRSDDEDLEQWDRGWVEASKYSRNNRYPTQQEQLTLS